MWIQSDGLSEIRVEAGATGGEPAHCDAVPPPGSCSAVQAVETEAPGGGAVLG
jgi:hypothetical protein